MVAAASPTPTDSQALKHKMMPGSSRGNVPRPDLLETDIPEDYRNGPCERHPESRGSEERRPEEREIGKAKPKAFQKDAAKSLHCSRAPVG